MSDVRLWSDVRTQAEIQANKDIILSGNESNLKGYWKLDEGSGSVAFDSSPSGYDGTIIDAVFVESEIGGSPDMEGCMDESACNYNPEATIDDISCD